MMSLGSDLPPPPGLTWTPTGARFSVFAGHAYAVHLRLVDPDGAESRVELAGPLHGWWYADLPGLRAGTRYVLHASGPDDPTGGLRYDASRPLLDPYAKAVDHEGWAVAVRADFDWDEDTAPGHSWSRTLIYEAHVRGLTRLHPHVPQALRGTYAGLAHPSVIDHLHRIGASAIELLPVHAAITEPSVAARGLTNYWGYNTLGFFAPNPRYAATTDPAQVVAEFAGMVKALHAAGIEVLLDVVYNHTAEQEMSRPALSWRGLDNRAYYRVDKNGREIDVTGCGNSVELTDPIAARMVLDSLRYWVQEMHVDGFRFDLAVALGRTRDNVFDPEHPFLTALRADPVLNRVKLIAEPWDIGPDGWRTGQFPPPFAEWNDAYRDDVRTFWLADLAAHRHGRPGHDLRAVATRMCGSADLFQDDGRTPTASINYVAAHDGFTTADLTAYEHKHNEANGEDNRDGSSHNLSYNHGVEGPSEDATILADRRRSIRNLLGTLLLSTGVPMLTAGDEFGRTQRGNNNAYCQDNEISWLDWQLADWQEDLLACVSELAAIRRAHPVLRGTRFFTGPAGPGGRPVLGWYEPSGQPLPPHAWYDPQVRATAMLLADPGPDAGEDVLILLNGGADEVAFTLPDMQPDRAYQLLWDSALERPAADGPVLTAGAQQSVSARSLQVWGAQP